MRLLRSVKSELFMLHLRLRSHLTHRDVSQHCEQRLLACALLLLTASACDRDESARQSDAITETRYVSRVVSAHPGGDTALVSYIKSCLLPVWHELRRDALLLEASVFALTEMDSTVRQDPEWDYLILARLGQGLEVRDLLARERASAYCERVGNQPYTVLRTEVLATTPRSFYPTPTVALRDRVNEVRFLVEFIAVLGLGHQQSQQGRLR